MIRLRTLAKVTYPAAVERALLCDLFLEVGPDAPTLSGDWTTRDLASHLVVRERRPDAMPGILTNVLAEHGEQVRLAEAAGPYERIVGRVRNGPPIWSPTSVPFVDRLVNTIEFFVHHEDVRRAADTWSARPMDSGLEAALIKLSRTSGKLITRKAPVGIMLAAEGHDAVVLHAGKRSVTIRGPIGECVLFLYGRSECDVELDGEPDDIAAIRATSFGI